MERPHREALGPKEERERDAGFFEFLAFPVIPVKATDTREQKQATPADAVQTADS